MSFTNFQFIEIKMQMKFKNAFLNSLEKWSLKFFCARPLTIVHSFYIKNYYWKIYFFLYEFYMKIRSAQNLNYNF